MRSLASVHRIVMLGPALDTRGGIAAVVNAYGAHGLFARWPLEYLATDSLLRAAAALVWLLVRERRVMLHVHGASRARFWRSSVFMALALAARAPYLLHLHGGGFADFYENGCGRLKRALARFFFSRAACIAVPTENARRWTSRVCPSTEVVCLPNPVEGMRLAPAARKRKMLLHLGRIEARKGLYELLQAFAALRARHPGASLVCAGEGDAEGARRFCALLGIDDAVVFTGWVGQDEKRLLLQRAAVFVLPSRLAGMPMGLLQAMEAGVPVIVAGGSELVVNDVNGLVYLPGDVAALRRLLDRVLCDPALAARLAARARSSVRVRCAAEQVVNRLGDLYALLGVRRGACGALIAAGEAR